MRDTIAERPRGVNGEAPDEWAPRRVRDGCEKHARFAEHDREDIQALAEEGLVNSKDLKKRAAEALKHYIGNPGLIKTSITLACRVIDKNQP